MNENVFANLISSRHSIRSFKDDLIAKEDLDTIVDAATKAPSSGNLQSYQIFAVTKSDDKKRLVEAAHGQEYIAQAPVALVFCADPKRCSTEYGKRGEELFCIQDATIACAYAQIESHSLGLSSVWIGSFDEDKVSEILKLQNSLRPVAILPVGVSNEIPEDTPRRPITEILQKL